MIQKTFVSYELADGQNGTARILAYDKIIAERTCQMNSWEFKDGPRLASVILYAALQRLHVIEEVSYEEFAEKILVDYSPSDAPEDTENPTR